MLSLKTLLLSALLPLVSCGPVDVSTRDTPGSFPAVTQFRISGNACPHNTGSVDVSGGWNNPSFHFKTFNGANKDADGSTSNCEVHFQGSGGSAGWQVAVSDVWFNGKVNLPAGSSLNYYWQIFWSNDAANTVTVEGTISNSGSYAVDVQRNTDRQVWSQCIGSDGNPGIFNANFRAALTGDNSASFEVDNERIDFVWRRC